MSKISPPLSMNTSALCALVFFVCFSFSFSVYPANNEDYEKGKAFFAQKEYKEAFIYAKNALQAEPDYLPAQILLAQLYQVNGMFNQADAAFQAAYDAGGDAGLIFESWGEVLLRLGESERILSLDFDSTFPVEARINWHTIRAKACIQQSRILCARYEYDQILTRAADHPKGLNGLALLAILERRFKEAESLLAKSMRQSDIQAQTWWLKGQLAKERREYAQAQTFYSKAFLLSPNNPTMARSLIDAYISSSDFDAALLITEDLLLQTEGDLYVLFVNSWLTSQVESLAVIRPQLEQIATQLANVDDVMLHTDPALYYLRGMVALMQKNYETARDNFLSYAKYTEEDVQTAILLASTNIALGDKKSAMSALQPHADTLIDNNIDQALMLGTLFLENKQNFAAVNLLNKLEEVYPNNVNVALYAVRVNLSRGKVAQSNAQLSRLKARYPENRQVLMTYALNHLNNGNSALAGEAIALLITRFPSDVSIQNMYAAQLIINKQYEKAQEVLDKVLIQSPRLFAARYNQATLLLQRNELDEAREILLSLSALRPEHLQVAFQLAKIDFQMGNLQAAISGFRKILVSNSAAAPSNVTFAAVAAYAQVSDYKRAIDLLRTLLASEPGNQVALVQLAGFYVKVRDKQQALTTLKKMDIIPSLSINTRLAQVALWTALGQQAKALEVMKGTHELVPGDKNIHLQLVKLMLASGELKAAATSLEILESDFPNDPLVRFKQGELAQAQGQLDTAYQYFENVLALDASFDLALAKLYSISVQQQSFNRLLARLDSIVKQDPTRYFPRNLLAQYHYYYGDRIQAIGHYQQLLSLVDDNSRYAMLNRLAILHFPTNTSQSFVYAKQAFELAPNNADVLHSYGWSLALNGRYKESLPILREASARDAISPSLKYRLAYTLYNLGSLDEAERILTSLLAVEEYVDIRSQAEALLTEIKR
ncbi:tetratricopeptide repeat protein [Alteromonas lipotrueae]|uniref:tetratricopeptide repeat protein n=1 Tax=Alteromonas lipotrueae TaxID=2803814 RepID=UPI001C460A2F|nr:tetratricopeptide repeat protein [Alteromonas lipotrueae]